VRCDPLFSALALSPAYLLFLPLQEVSRLFRFLVIVKVEQTLYFVIVVHQDQVQSLHLRFILLDLLDVFDFDFGEESSTDCLRVGKVRSE
jgi:hypothetical protein